MASKLDGGSISLPQDPVPMRELESHVVKTLQSGGIKGDTLKEMAKAVASLNTAGFRPVRVFPKGIPFPDGAWVQTFVTPQAAGRFFELLQEMPEIEEIRLFPKGIPFPDILQAEIGIR